MNNLRWLAPLVLGPIAGVWLNATLRAHHSRNRAALLAFLITWAAVSVVSVRAEEPRVAWQAIVIGSAVPVGLVLLVDALTEPSPRQRILLVIMGFVGVAAWLITAVVVQLLFFPLRDR